MSAYLPSKSYTPTPAMPRAADPARSTDMPVRAQYAGEDFVVGAGVAIFHIASQRVVVCSAPDPRRRGEQYFFLPKGRRDAGEEGRTGAEREGYEESGYRNRVLPLPTKHRQPLAHPRIAESLLTAEPVWMQLMPLGYQNKQYVLYWYVAETLPPGVEDALVTDVGAAYRPPPAYPQGLTLRERVMLEPEGYEPRHHQGTGVNEEEAMYESHLLGIEDAVERLGGRHSVMADVVLRGWKGIQDRFAMEEAHDATTQSPEAMH